MTSEILAPAYEKMSMGGMSSSHSASASPACKISMLWNWYTIDTCFIARSWHVKSRGMFAGSCIGVFFLVFASQWLHRFCREYDFAIIRRKQVNDTILESSSDSLPMSMAPTEHPMVYAITHKWLLKTPEPSQVTSSIPEHFIRSVLFTIEWGLSYIIMLLFMYYNGYIIISCILGALFGKLVFTYNEPLNHSGSAADSEELDRKCCK